jgi:hypothetical protein
MCSATEPPAVRMFERRAGVDGRLRLVQLTRPVGRGPHEQRPQPAGQGLGVRFAAFVLACGEHAFAT